jgi:hypothetical protein
MVTSDFYVLKKIGNLDILTAFKLGQAPMFTFAVTLGKSMKSGEWRRGVSIVFED